MGFFDFLRGKDELPQPEDAGRVELVKVKELVEKSVSGELRRERKKAEDLYAKIREGIREIKKLNARLAEKKFEENEKIYTPVNMVKDNYVRKTSSMLNSVPLIENFTYSEITDFCSGMSKILNEVQNIPPKQAVLLSRYFKNETSRIIKILKEISEAGKDMRSLLDKSRLRLENEINSRIDRILGLKRKLTDLEKEEKLLLEKTESKKREIEERERELKTFLSGEEHSRLEKLQNEIKKLREEKDELEREIRDSLSGIKRPLKKLDHSLKNEKDKEKRSILSKVTHSPFKTLFLEQGDSMLLEALAKLREFDLKDSERERVEELSKKIELGYISKLRDRYKWLESEIAEKEEEMRSSDFQERVKGMEREIENLKHQISELKKERKRVEEIRDDVTKEISKEKTDLESLLLREINKKLDIIV